MIPIATREKIFLEYCEGNFKTLGELAEKHGIKYNTLTRWIHKYRWRERRKSFYDESTRDGAANLKETIAEVNQTHMRAWKLLLGQALVHVQPETDARGKPVPVDIDTLSKAASVVRLAQMGQRLAMGADLPDAAQPDKVTVTFGSMSPDGEISGGSLREISVEMIEQYKKNFSEDRLRALAEEGEQTLREIEAEEVT